MKFPTWIVCPIYLCDGTYEAFSAHTRCPKCFISLDEMDEAGTNEREYIFAMKQRTDKHKMTIVIPN